MYLEAVPSLFLYLRNPYFSCILVFDLSASSLLKLVIPVIYLLQGQMVKTLFCFTVSLKLWQIVGKCFYFTYVVIQSALHEATQHLET